MSKLVEIGNKRQIIAFDSQSDESNANESEKRLPVIFLHGFPDNLFNFRHVAPILVKAGHRCILPSCAGYDFVNKSTKIDGSLGIKSVANAYCIAIDTLLGNKEIKSSKSIGHFYHLVGHDWELYMLLIWLLKFMHNKLCHCH